MISLILYRNTVLNQFLPYNFLVCQYCTLRNSKVIKEKDESNRNDHNIREMYHNRNPRNLEKMALARKRKGWKYQYPSPTYYHRLNFDASNANISATVEHSSGKVVLSASTKEFSISRLLYSRADQSAARNIGCVLSRRCLESGITCMVPYSPEHGEKSLKYKEFLTAMEKGGIDLTEPDEIVPEYEHGIDYDDESAVAELKERQKRVLKTTVRWGSKESHWI